MNSQERQCEAEGNCGKAGIGHERWIAGVSMMAGAALGATVMYFCDPHRGKARRAELQQKAASAARQGGHELGKRAEDLLNRAKGAVSKVDAAFEPSEEVVNDDVIAGRVRSHMGHITEHVGDIQTEVVSGVVALRGTVSANKHRHLVDEVLAVSGVKGVRDLLVSAGSV
jgi:osmotically-inducible protein OsmY